MDDAAPLLQDYLEDSAARSAEKVALTCGGQSFTYGELDGAANALAQTLVRGGVQRGDRVVIFADNGPVAAIAFWAALKASAVAVVLGPQTRPHRLAYVLRDCGARALVSQAHLAPAFSEAAPVAASMTAAVVAGELRARPPLPVVSWTEA